MAGDGTAAGGGRCHFPLSSTRNASIPFSDKKKVFDLAQPVLANVSSVQYFQPSARDGLVEVTEAQLIPQETMRALFISGASQHHIGNAWHGPIICSYNPATRQFIRSNQHHSRTPARNSEARRLSRLVGQDGRENARNRKHPRRFPFISGSIMATGKHYDMKIHANGHPKQKIIDGQIKSTYNVH